MKILTLLQKNFLDAFFASSLKDEFFLTGGTALAEFYLKHRKSQDLDLFTLDQELDFDFVNAEIQKIARNLNLEITNQVSSSTYLQYIFSYNKMSLKIDVVKDIPIHFGKLEKIKNVWVDSLENIAVNKVLAIFGRTDAKDFIDLFFLTKEKGLKFDSLFKKAKKKDLGLNEFYLANMLAEVENLKIFPKTTRSFDKKEMQKFFLSLSKKLFLKIKPKKT